VSTSSPPDLIANYTPVVTFEMTGGAEIVRTLTDIITFARPTIDAGTLAINGGAPLAINNVTTFGAVSVSFTANEWQFDAASVYAGLAAAGIVHHCPHNDINTPNWMIDNNK
jgi:hypothetical protein